MAKQYLCGGTKYEIGGPKKDTIGLPVMPAGLPPTLEVEGYTLSLKTELHVSLVCAGKIAEKNNIADPEFVSKVVADFCEFTQHTSIDFLRYRNEFKFAADGERRTVVIMCDISNLDKFFDLLNQKYNLQLEYPPTHVTLYTLQPNIGIFLTDSDDIKRLSKPVEVPIKL